LPISFECLRPAVSTEILYNEKRQRIIQRGEIGLETRGNNERRVRLRNRQNHSQTWRVRHIPVYCIIRGKERAR